MALDFPNSPSLGGSYTSGGQTWTWDGTAWNLATTSISNVAGGLAGQSPYQSGPRTTSFVPTGPTGSVFYANGTGSPAWTTTGPTGSVLVANGTAAPTWSLSPFVFTNEAARDAAIVSPTEGMQVYLTAPTVPTVAGDTYAAVPTGVQTIYNGSVWVCVTEIGSTTNTQGTTASATYTGTLTSGGTNPSVTLVTGTQALVMLSCLTTNTALSNNFISFAVSGATTLAAGDAQSASVIVTSGVAGYSYAASRQFVLSGLTAGTNTFTLNYKVGGSTGSFSQRSLVVKGIA